MNSRYILYCLSPIESTSTYILIGTYIVVLLRGSQMELSPGTTVEPSPGISVPTFLRLILILGVWNMFYVVYCVDDVGIIYSKNNTIYSPIQ